MSKNKNKVLTTAEVVKPVLDIPSELIKIKKDINSIKAELGQIRAKLNKDKDGRNISLIKGTILRFFGNAKSFLFGKRETVGKRK